MIEGLHKISRQDGTIVAISTPFGRSAIAIIRLSGREALRITGLLFRSAHSISHKHATVGQWCDQSAELLDEVVVTFSQAPHSYTGEDLVEISAHGNPVNLNRIVQSIIDVGARPAGPGEFTLRAVANGKLDLIQAEAVRNFIEAQTRQQSRHALLQLKGAGARRLNPIKQRLVDLIAQLEAGIDFAEDDVDVPTGESVARQIQPLFRELNVVKETFGYGRILADGLRLTILGKPNVGKSSLFNRLVDSERAIVTDVPGTTRDVLSETISLEGIPLRLMDTAGLRNTADKVERLGVGRSLETLAESDLALVVLDGSTPIEGDDEEALKQTANVAHLVVINKSDLPERIELRSNGKNPIRVSAVTGQGIEALRREIRDFLLERPSDSADDFVLTNARQHAAVAQAIKSLESASTAALNNVPHEMVLLDLYAGLGAMNELTGETVTEDILDRIFSTFCIGK